MVKSRKEKQMSAMLFNTRASTTWSEDNAKFGQRMLEKMGWKKGQGLGTHSQGVTENIKLRLKLDSKGLGYKTSDHDQWLQVEHNFSTVLSRLNEDINKDVIDVDRVPGTTQSLESKSMTSKSRVHYRKFTRGKDVSRYNEKDLIGILGQKTQRQLEENIELEHQASYERTEESAADELRDMGKPMFSTGEERTKMSEEVDECAKLKNISSDTLVDRHMKKRRKNRLENEDQVDENVAVAIETASLGLISPSSCSKRKKIAKESIKKEDANSEDTCSDPFDASLFADTVHKNNSKDVEDRVEDIVERDSSRAAKVLRQTDENSLAGRKKSKAENITEEKRLLKKLLNEQVRHEQVAKESIKKEDANSEDICSDPSDASLIAYTVQKNNSKDVEDGVEDFVEHDSPRATKVPRRTDENTLAGRKKTKAENITEKKRLLQKLLNDQVRHEFVGSNLKNISGYGNDSK